MNNKVTFPKLASLLADKSGRSKRFSEDFLRELFAVITEQLEAGASVKVKGIGTFRLVRVEPRKSVDVTTGLPMEIAGHSKVVFTPAKELTEAVNAPFEAFVPVEIGEGVELDKIADDIDVEVNDDSEDIALEITQSEERPVEELQIQSEEAAPELPLPEVDDAPSAELPLTKEDDAQAAEMPLPEEPTVDDKILVKENRIDLIQIDDDDDDITIIDDGKQSQYVSDASQRNLYDGEKKNWLRTLLIGAACGLFAVLATFLIWSLLTKPDFSNVNNQDSDFMANYRESELNPDVSDIAVGVDSLDNKEITPVSGDEKIAETAEDVPTEPSDALVYDTIGTARFLTTMAKDHYGNNKFWPYIYEENKSHIGHPDRIRPGTPIVIPSLIKYGVDPKNKKDEAKANKLGAEIYARYGKTL